MMKNKESLFTEIAIIGIGLIGSSLARVIKKKSIANKISISTRSKKTLEKSIALQLGDFYSTNIAETVSNADFITFFL